MVTCLLSSFRRYLVKATELIAELSRKRSKADIWFPDRFKKIMWHTGSKLGVQNILISG